MWKIGKRNLIHGIVILLLGLFFQQLLDHRCQIFIKKSITVFHNLSTIQERQYCQLHFSCAFKNEQEFCSLETSYAHDLFSHLLIRCDANKKENSEYMEIQIWHWCQYLQYRLRLSNIRNNRKFSRSMTPWHPSEILFQPSFQGNNYSLLPWPVSRGYATSWEIISFQILPLTVNREETQDSRPTLGLLDTDNELMGLSLLAISSSENRMHGLTTNIWPWWLGAKLLRRN